MTIESLDTKSIFENAIDSIINDKINNIKIGEKETFGNKVQNIAKTIKAGVTHNLRKIVVETIFAFMDQRTNLITESEIAKLARSLHQHTLNDVYHHQFASLTDTKTNEFGSMYTSLCFNILVEIMRSQIHQKEEEFKEGQLTEGEQQVLRYTAGYILFSMRRKYYKLEKSTQVSTRETSAGVLNFIDSVNKPHNVQGSTFLDFTKEWIELKNRGGLIEITDDFYIFIRRVENYVKATLTFNFMKTYRNEDLRDIIYDRLEKSFGIQNTWNYTSRAIANPKLALMLKKQILMKWVDIRARSFVKCYIELVKTVAKKDKAKKVSETVEPSTRKKLSR